MASLKTTYADILPPLSTEEFEVLRASIERDGVQVPILTDGDSEIIDGRSRYEIDPKCPKMVLPGAEKMSPNEKKAAAIRLNVARRNLSSEQKEELAKKQHQIATEFDAELNTDGSKRYGPEDIGAMLAVHETTIRRWLELLVSEQCTDTSNSNEDRAKAVKAAWTAQSPDQTEELRDEAREVALALKSEKDEKGRKRFKPEQIAKILGIAEKLVLSWLKPKKKKRQKLDRDDEDEIWERVIVKGESQVQVAADLGISQQRVAQIIKKINKVKEQAEREAEAAKKISKTRPWVLTSEQTIVKCDALITDAPYGILDEPWEPAELKKFTLEWCSRWNDCEADMLALFWSQRFLFDGKEWFDRGFANYKFQQLLVWHYPNNKSPQSRMGFKQTWEPIFFYRRRDSEKEIKIAGTEWGDEFNDFDCHVAAVPQGNFTGADKKCHPAQKPVSVFRWLISCMTRKGELVCDPFAGSGASGIAACQLNRRWYGVELDSNYLKSAEKRIAAYGK